MLSEALISLLILLVVMGDITARKLLLDNRQTAAWPNTEQVNKPALAIASN